MNSELNSLHSLLNVTEELLFSFPLPTELVKKYEAMKQGVYGKIGVSYSHSKLWKLQREAYQKQKAATKSIETQATQDSPEQEQLFSLKLREIQENANVIRLELLERTDASHVLNSSYQSLCNYIGTTFAGFATKLAGILSSQGYSFSCKNPIDLSQAEPCHDGTLPVSELGHINEQSTRRYRKIESVETEVLREFEQQFAGLEKGFHSCIAEIAEILETQQKAIEELENDYKTVNGQHFSTKRELCMKIEEEKDKYELEIIELKNSMAKARQELLSSTGKQLAESKDHYEQAILTLSNSQKELQSEIEKTNSSYSNDRAKWQERTNIFNKQSKSLENDRKKLKDSLEVNRIELEHSKAHEHSLKEQLHIGNLNNITLQQELANSQKELEDLHRKSQEEINDLKTRHLEYSLLADRESKDQYTHQLHESTQEIQTLEDLLQKNTNEYQETLNFLEFELKQERENTNLLQYQLRSQEALVSDYCSIQAKRDQALNTTDNFVQKLRETLTTAYFKHNKTPDTASPKKELPREYSELLCYAEFVCALCDRTSNDNKWLIDRLAEMGQELDKLHYLKPLKSDPPLKHSRTQMMSDIRTTVKALEEFECSRDKLVKHFH